MSKELLYSCIVHAASERMFVTLCNSCEFGAEHVAAYDKQLYMMFPCSYIASETLHLASV